MMMTDFSKGAKIFKTLCDTEVISYGKVLTVEEVKVLLSKK